MSNRHVEPLPVPRQTLLEMRAELPSQYGYRHHEEGDQRFLVACVPREEPDLVNDLEGVVEALHPRDLDDVHRVLLVGTRRVTGVPPHQLKDLLAERVRFDQRQCRHMRDQIAPGKHVIYKSPEDPLRHPRLVIHVAAGSVQDLDVEDFGHLADELGPQIESVRFQEVHCVYLIAGKDHVRLRPQPFYDDLLTRWNDVERREQVAAERRAREGRERRIREAERDMLLKELEYRYGSKDRRVARAPLRRDPVAGVGHAGGSAAQRDPEDAHAGPGEGPLPGDRSDEDRERRKRYRGEDVLERAAALQDTPSDRDTASLHDASDRDARDAVSDEHVPFRSRSGSGPLDDGEPLVEEEDVVSASDDPIAHVQQIEGRVAALQERTHAQEARRENQQALHGLKERLETAGFDTLTGPDTPPQIDLAAERDGPVPRRIVAICTDRLVRDEAVAFVASAQEMDVDMALAVADTLEAEARSAILGTPVKFVRPDDLPTLRI